MKKQSVQFNTIEEMVKYVVEMRDTVQRWSLEDRTNWEFADPQAGTAWDDARPADSKWDSPEYKAWQDAKPEMVKISQWYLYHRDGTWYSTSITLSTELGDAIDKVWTKKPSRYGSGQDRVGSMTLTGILKRLGRTDVADVVKAAQDKAEAERAKRNRNYTRVNVAAKISELIEFLQSPDAQAIGMHSETVIDFAIANISNLTLEE